MADTCGQKVEGVPVEGGARLGAVRGSQLGLVTAVSRDHGQGGRGLKPGGWQRGLGKNCPPEKGVGFEGREREVPGK